MANDRYILDDEMQMMQAQQEHEYQEIELLLEIEYQAYLEVLAKGERL